MSGVGPGGLEPPVPEGADFNDIGIVRLCHHPNGCLVYSLYTFMEISNLARHYSNLFNVALTFTELARFFNLHYCKKLQHHKFFQFLEYSPRGYQLPVTSPM